MAVESRMLRGELRHDEPMARHTSWRVGGPARCWYRPADIEDAQRFLAGVATDEPLYWVGLGSNLLVRDGGIPGTLVAPGGGLTGLRRLGETGIYAEAGVTSARLARFCAQAGLAGAEFLAGIPGTLGGALAMNAGAFGGETWDLVRRVCTLDRGGRLRWRPATAFVGGYRSVRGLKRDEWFVAAELALRPGADAAALQQRIRDLLATRGRHQPTGQPSCGSVFRNPPGDYAGRLIEAAGLKGHRIGGAHVSERHANFIVNSGHATAADIEQLILEIQQRVEQRFGIHLQPEVRILGVAAGAAP